jgi:hypothetical protein
MLKKVLRFWLTVKRCSSLSSLFAAIVIFLNKCYNIRLFTNNDEESIKPEIKKNLTV